MRDAHNGAVTRGLGLKQTLKISTHGSWAVCIATGCTVDPHGESTKRKVTRVAIPPPPRSFAIDSDALPPPPTNRSANCGWALPGASDCRTLDPPKGQFAPR